jgi:predicted RNase H-like HicB family nuclease
MRYAVVIEKGPASYGAYVPDLPGCVAVGKSAAEAKKLIAEAIPWRLEGLRENGLQQPERHSQRRFLVAPSGTFGDS